MKQHKIQRMNVEELRVADYNPREIDDKALAGLKNSVERFGLVEPIVWNKKTKTIVGGHQRLKVLIDSGEKDVEVVVVNLTKKEEKELNVALNNPAIAGTFTDDLQELLQEMKVADSQSFDDLRFDELLVDDLERQLGKNDDNAPAVPETPTSSVGDLWILGDHRLVCGDCTDQDVVKLVCGTERAECMWTDPPYGVNYEGGEKGKRKKIANDTPEDLPGLLALSFSNAMAIALSPGASVYIAHPAKRISIEFSAAVIECGFIFRQGLIWAKDSMVLGRSDYHYRHEPIIYARVPVDAGEGMWGRGGSGWYGDNSQTSVFNIQRPKSSKDHPTMKPVELIAAMLINSTRPGSFVYEPFAGSGSTLIACERLHRKCLAIELDPGYVDVIVKRWEEITGRKAELA
jgi:DNA modification methylase